MKKTILPIILLCTLSIHAMEQDYKQLALLAEEYNNNNSSLTKLPKEILIEVFSYSLAKDIDQNKALENSIKNFMKLSMICKKFNSLLPFETIGNFCKDYTQENKNKTLKHLVKSTLARDYTFSRLPAFIIIHAGTDQVQSSLLLRRAITYNDIQLATLLLNNHTDPHEDGVGNAIFFYAKTLETMQLLIDKGIDIHTDTVYNTNVLWPAIQNKYALELMIFYRERGVDASRLRSFDNSCLLHKLAIVITNELGVFTTDDTDNLLKKAILLLNAIPNMINTLNKKGQTPLDLAEKSLKELPGDSDGKWEAFEKLIALFKQHGGLTAQELKKHPTEKGRCMCIIF